MSFLNIPVDEAQEPTTVAEGEYQVRITDAKVEKSKKTGNDMVVLTVTLPNEVSALPMFEYLVLPTASDDAVAKNRKELALKRLMEAVDVKSVDNIDELIGKEARALVKVEASTDPQYSDKNRISRWIKA